MRQRYLIGFIGSLPVALVALLVACGNEPAQLAPLSTPPVTKDAAVVGEDGATPPEPSDSAHRSEIYAEGLCAYDAKCRQVYRVWEGTGATCIETLRVATDDLVKLPGHSASADEIAACNAKLGASSCADNVDTVAECHFKGTLANGEQCKVDGQCASGTCKRPSGNCGVCAEPVLAGGACEGTTECAPGTRCLSKKCVAIGRLDEVCESTAACAAGLRCVSNKCVPLLDQGADCGGDLSDACDGTKNLLCRPGGSGPQSCQPTAYAKVNEPCVCDSDHAVCTFCELSSCVNGTCTVTATQPGQTIPDGGACQYPSAASCGVCVGPYSMSCSVVCL